MPKYVAVFPETADSPAVPSEELVREVMEALKSPAPLATPFAKYLVADPFDQPSTEVDPPIEGSTPPPKTE
jgi:hypothetical protein